MGKLLVAIVVTGVGVLLLGVMSLSSESASAQTNPAAPDWKPLGEKGYRDNCMVCHGPAGAGMGKMYPALTAIGPLAATPAGREYLIDVQLYGAASDRHSVPMAPMAHLRDNEIAAVLNHVATSFGNKADQLFTAEEVAKQRGQKITAKQVGAKRPAIAQN